VAKKTVIDIKKKKAEGKKVTMLTAYEYIFASLLSSCGVDILLVGDSLASIFAGHENTLPATVDEMIYHTKAVVRGAGESMVVTDMPFLSYQINISETKRNAGRMIKEGGAQGVKIEGGSELVIETISALTEIEIPVMAHLGLTPQSIHKLGGYKVQGKGEEAEKLIRDAKRVQDAGAFSLVLECVPELLAKEITESVDIPTIGIGAGRYCDGQVLVTQDILGMYERVRPKFVKRYKELGAEIKSAVKSFKKEVEEGKFPSKEHSFK
jgi:3-methyl-2-oxobutanoate hydroxymethyltransferase